MLDHAGLAERDVVEKTQGANRLVEGTPGTFFLVEQKQLILADLFQAQFLTTTPVNSDLTPFLPIPVEKVS